MSDRSTADAHADAIRRLWVAGVQAKHIAFRLRITEGAVKWFIHRARGAGEGWAKRRARGPRPFGDAG